MARGDLSINKESNLGDVSINAGQVTQPAEQPSTTPSSTGYTYGGGGYGGGGGGGGGGSSAPTDEDTQKKTQASIGNLGDIYDTRAGDMAKNTKGRRNDLAKIAKGRWGDMNKNAADQLNNVNRAVKANNAMLGQNRSNIMKQVGWQPNEQKKQSMLMNQRNRMGNAAYGSSLVDLAEGMKRIDDMMDVELIDAWKQNEDAAYSNWFQANEGLVSDFNEQIASINENMSQFGADYADQMSKLKADFNDEMSKTFSQYWTTLNNQNPELATKENMTQAEKNARSKAYQRAKSDLDYLENSTTWEDWTTGYAKEPETKKPLTQAIGSIKNAIAKTNGKAAEKQVDKIEKSAKKAAAKYTKEQQKEAEKKRDKAIEEARNRLAKYEVSQGEGTDKYTLPNVNLHRNLNFDVNSNPFAMSKELQALMKPKDSASAKNARTAAFVRGDAARPRSGNLNRSGAANSSFYDALSAFRSI